jgi:4'-phosphopantetheinyl transferase
MLAPISKNKVMKLLYASINDVSDKDIEPFTKLLPVFMQAYIKRFSNESDRKHRLLARLMLRRCIIHTTGNDMLLHAWQTDVNNKPFIPQWHQFNISHSGEFVVFIYDDQAIGVDIEKREDIDYASLSDYFHPEEKSQLIHSRDKKNTFYTIWAKKEALLKAVGIGISNVMAEFNCLEKSIIYENQTWFFYPVEISTEYTCYICTDKIIFKQELMKFNQLTLPDFDMIG